MIIEIRAKNAFSFTEQVALLMKADMRNKKFATNVHRENNFNILKAAGIYGPNNAGKTCLVRCIRAIRNVLLDQESGAVPNMFTEDSVYALGVTFLSGGRKFCYDFKSTRGIPPVIPPVDAVAKGNIQIERILEFCSLPKGILEIVAMLEYKDKKTVGKYLKPLVEQGRLAMTIPDKPNSSNQKYVTVR